MEENKFFKLIWRMVAIGMLIMIITGLYGFIRNEVERQHRPSMDKVEAISTLAKDPQKVEKWVLKVAPDMADNSEYTILSLYSKYNKVEGSGKNYYETTNNVVGYSRERSKNILFVNTKENSSSWLFPTNHQLILDYGSDVHLSRYGMSYYIETNKKNKAKFIYYKVINKDSNGDKIITEADHLIFAVSDISGENYRVIIEDIESIISMKTINKESMSLIYQKAGIAHSLKLNINSFEIISDVVLPKVGE